MAGLKRGGLVKLVGGETGYDPPIGTRGKVIKAVEYPDGESSVLVRFEGWHNGHGDGAAEWFVGSSQLKPLAARKPAAKKPAKRKVVSALAKKPKKGKKKGKRG